MLSSSCHSLPISGMAPMWDIGCSSSFRITAPFLWPKQRLVGDPSSEQWRFLGILHGIELVDTKECSEGDSTQYPLMISSYKDKLFQLLL